MADAPSALPAGLYRIDVPLAEVQVDAMPAAGRSGGGSMILAGSFEWMGVEGRD